MPLTPETWLDTFTVNSVRTGSQFDPAITQLADGDILVSWTSDADVGAGRPDATLLSDGRVMVTWDRNGEVEAQIVDTRDAANAFSTPGTPQIGTIGDDNFVRDADVVAGHDGDDFSLFHVSLIGASASNLLSANRQLDAATQELRNFAGDARLTKQQTGTMAPFDTVSTALTDAIGGNDTIMGNRGAEVLDGQGGIDTLQILFENVASLGSDQLDLFS